MSGTIETKVGKRGSQMRDSYHDDAAATQRIKQLQSERIYQQQKTFTKWMQSIFKKAGIDLSDLDIFKDLNDGTLLLRLMELISGEDVGKPNRGKMKVQKIENLNKVLKYISSKTRLENISAEDILDGNPTLILGLMWTTILRFEIQVIQENLERSRAEEGEMTLQELGVDEATLEEMKKKYPELFGTTDAVQQALAELYLSTVDLDTKLGDLPPVLTLRDLGVKDDNLPEGASPHTTLADLPAEMTLRDLGFTEHDMPAVKDRIHRSCLVHCGLIYQDVMPNTLNTSTTLGELPPDMTLRDLGLDEKQLAKNVSPDITLKQLSSEYQLKDLGFKDEELPKLRDSANRSYQLRHEPIYANVVPVNINTKTMMKELPQDLEVRDLGLHKKNIPKEYSDTMLLRELPPDMTLAELGVLKEDIPNVQRSANLNYTLRHAPVYRNAIPADITQETLVSMFPEDMTLSDLGITKEQLPEAVSTETTVRNLPKGMKVRDLGYDAKDLPVVREHANATYQLKHGPVYSNVLPASLSPETKVTDLPQDLTLREVGIKEHQVPAKVSLDTNLEEMPNFMTLKSLGVEKEDIPQIRDCAMHCHQVKNGPLYWDCLPIEMTPDTKLKELPQDMTLRDLQVIEVPAGMSADTMLCDLPGNLTLRDLGYTEAEIPLLRQHANQNYQLRRGPVIVTESTAVHQLPQKLTLGEIGLSEEQIKQLPGSVTQETTLSELQQDLTLADLGVNEVDGVQRVKSVANPDPIATKYSAVELSADMKLSELPEGVSKEMLGIDEETLNKYIAEKPEGKEKQSAKEALLMWCKSKTDGHENCEVQNFSQSWNDGMAFCALIHTHRPDLIDYDSLDPEERVKNLNYAFDIAEQELGIPQLLDAEDVAVKRPDEKSIMTYIASYYHTFAKMKDENTSSKRIGKELAQVSMACVLSAGPFKEFPIVNFMMDIDEQKEIYEQSADELLKWIQNKTAELNDPSLPNSMEATHQELAKFHDYIRVEKPLRYKEKGELEAQLFDIQTKLNAESRSYYQPPEGKLVSDVEKAWQQLEKAEHAREVALRDNLRREEKLEQLAEKFNRKAELRESWLADQNKILDNMPIGETAKEVELAAKRHVTMTTEVLARKDRFDLLKKMAEHLAEADYHETTVIKAKHEKIADEWHSLLLRMNEKQNSLDNVNSVISLMRDIDSLNSEMKHLEPGVDSNVMGNELIAADHLVEKHALLDSEVKSAGEKVNILIEKAEKWTQENPALKKEIERMADNYALLNAKSEKRKADLAEAYAYYKLVDDAEQEEAWLAEKQTWLKQAPEPSRDIYALYRQLQAHDAVEAEMQAHAPVSNTICVMGSRMNQTSYPLRAAEVNKHMNILQEEWHKLKSSVAARKIKLEDALESAQYYADAEEATQWIKERMPLAASDDFGRDEASAQALLQKHKILEEEIRAYDADIQRLNNYATLMTQDAQQHKIPPESAVKRLQEEEGTSAGGEEEEDVEYHLVPVESEEEIEMVMQVMEEFVELKISPRVKMRYPYSGHGVDVKKGEVLKLRAKSNEDWWSVVTSEGTRGFVPATYVTEIEADTQLKTRQEPISYPAEKMKVTKVEMVKKPKPKSKKVRRTPSLRSKDNLHYDKANVEKTQKAVNDSYRKLSNLSEARRVCLEDAMRLYRFYRDCDNFETWLLEKEKILCSDDSDLSPELQKRKHEKQLTEIMAQSNWPQEINEAAEDIFKYSHTIKEPVKQRLKEVNDEWEMLQQLLLEKEKSFQGALSLELFDQACAETALRIKEKFDNVDAIQPSHSTHTNSLQKDCENIDREIKPVEDEIERLDALANTVRTNFPEESPHVEEKLKDLQQLWSELQKKAEDKKVEFELLYDKKVVADDSTSLLLWTDDVKAQLSEEKPAHDVGTAEALLKQHQDLYDEIKSRDDDVEDLKQQFEKLESKCADPLLKQNINVIDNAHTELMEAWVAKQKKLQVNYDLQVFNKEADYLDKLAADQDRFLDIHDKGSSIDDVQKLMKRQDEFDNKLQVQEERLKKFHNSADAMVEGKHPDAEYIKVRKQTVEEERAALIAKSLVRKEELDAALTFHTFNHNAEELTKWMSSKEEELQKQHPEQIREMSSVSKTVKKHSAFMAEVRANEEWLTELNKEGEKMIEEDHYAAANIRRTLDELNQQWANLHTFTVEIEALLKVALDAQDVTLLLSHAQSNLEEIEQVLDEENKPVDLRSARTLLNEQQTLEKQIENELVEVVRIQEAPVVMARNPTVMDDARSTSVEEFKTKYEALQHPAAERRKLLETTVAYHQFIFDVEAEMQWIQDHEPAAASTNYGKNLTDAQNLTLKHQKFQDELEGHEPSVRRKLAEGKTLLESDHPESADIEQKVELLKNSWGELKNKSAERTEFLNLFLDGHKFNADAADLEQWLTETMQLCDKMDYGKDQDATAKLLTKHKALESEIDSHSSMVRDLEQLSDSLTSRNHPDAKLFRKRQKHVDKQMAQLEKLAADRRAGLEDAQDVHAFLLDAEDLIQTLHFLAVHAKSEEFGQDYEHAQELQDRHTELKSKVEVQHPSYLHCVETANKLCEEDTAYSATIIQKNNELQKAWSDLISAVEFRDGKLDSIAELHRFNRDVAEVLSRIQEKHAAMPQDLGRDQHSVSRLIKNHEMFENELEALEAQLQVVIADAVRLSESLPEDGVTDIRRKEQQLFDNWEQLQTAAADRQDLLQMARDYHKYMADTSSILSWVENVQTQMNTEHHVRDVSGVHVLKSNHNLLKTEIDGREEEFAKLESIAAQICEGNHYASVEIQARAKLLDEVHELLLEAWKEKDAELEDLLQYQQFLKDAHLLETASATEETYLKSGEIPSTVQELEAAMKRHDAFEKAMQGQDDKMIVLTTSAQKLADARHKDKKDKDAADIYKIVDKVANCRKDVKMLADKRKDKLNEALQYAKLHTDIAEASAWIAEKQRLMDRPLDEKSDATIQEKMKRLQKYQAIEAELYAVEPSIKQIEKNGNTLIAHNHPNSTEIQEELSMLLQHWDKLQKSADNRSRALADARDMLTFYDKVERADAWVKEKELQVHAGETGRDYEHCEELLRKLDDKDKPNKITSQTIRDINDLADNLLQDASEASDVDETRKELNVRWATLQCDMAEYKDKLNGALEVHTFVRDCDDVNDLINEKTIALFVEEDAKDLDSVELMQRKKEMAENDMNVISDRIQKLKDEAKRLDKYHPDKRSLINQHIDEVLANWEKLHRDSDARRVKLEEMQKLHRFLYDVHNLVSWTTDMESRMTSAQFATSLSEADAQLQQHQEYKAEIEGRAKEFNQLISRGENMINQMSDYNSEIAQNVNQLKDMRTDLDDVWEERQKRLKQCRDLQIFREQADQADSWLSSKEAFLTNDDLGSSSAEVKALLRKHENFEASLSAHEDTIDDLQAMADDLWQEGHYDYDSIQIRLDQILDRQKDLQKASSLRKAKLEDSMKLHEYFNNANEVTQWMQEKMTLACDESFLDPVNLQHKIQKHQTFEAELLANKKLVTAVKKEGEGLIADGHDSTELIEDTILALQNSWQTLMDTSRAKRERLHEAYEAQLYMRAVEDLENWCQDVETVLVSEDYGKDLASVQRLIKKHQHLEIDIANHAVAVKKIEASAKKFDEQQHFMNEEIQEKAKQIAEDYNKLAKPAHIRKENLHDSLQLHHFIRDLEQETAWIEEKLPVASSIDLGNDLTAVTNLQKKHQALEAEILAHEPLIENIISTAEHMIATGHFASKDIQDRLTALMNLLQELKDNAADRQKNLLDSFESQTFYVKAKETEQYMEEKMSTIKLQELGKSEDAVKFAVRKLDAIDTDIENFTATMKELKRLGNGLIHRHHFDNLNIKKCLECNESKYLELIDLSKSQRKALHHRAKLLHFQDKADDFQAWMEEMMVIASSEEYGEDVEHVQAIQEKYDAFMDKLENNASQLDDIKTLANQLHGENHPQSPDIRDRCSQLNKQWEELWEQAQRRKEALVGAKEVHEFDRDADELIEWIQEKQAILAADDDIHNMDVIEQLKRKHKTLERDLHAIEQQLQSLDSRVQHLADDYPDSAENLEARQAEAHDAWALLLDDARKKKLHLDASENLRSYFDNYNELMAWINQMMAVITAEELPQDVIGAELLINKHKEHRVEIDGKMKEFTDFTNRGQHLIAEKHFLADDIQDKVNNLNLAKDQLVETWQRRAILYDQNLDAQIFKRDADHFESWMQAREPTLMENKFGQNIKEAEELLRKHEDFEKTVDAQKERVKSLKRETAIEKAFREQMEVEAKRKEAVEKTKEKERLERLTLREQRRLLEERQSLEKEDKVTESTEVFAMPIHSSPSPAEREFQTSASVPLSQETPVQSAGSPKSHYHTTPTKDEEHVHQVVAPAPHKPKELTRVASLRRKDVRRTPSFSTRKGIHKNTVQESLPPVTLQGPLERKHELITGKKKATIRSWKQFHVVLCQDILCFFKTKEQFESLQSSASHPLGIHRALVGKASDYKKRPNVFRLQLLEGAEYLFQAPSEESMIEWIQTIQRSADATHQSVSHLASLQVKESPVLYTKVPDKPRTGTSSSGTCSSDDTLTLSETKKPERILHKAVIKQEKKHEYTTEPTSLEKLSDYASSQENPQKATPLPTEESNRVQVAVVQPCFAPAVDHPIRDVDQSDHDHSHVRDDSSVSSTESGDTGKLATDGDPFPTDPWEFVPWNNKTSSSSTLVSADVQSGTSFPLDTSHKPPLFPEPEPPVYETADLSHVTVTLQSPIKKASTPPIFPEPTRSPDLSTGTSSNRKFPCRSVSDAGESEYESAVEEIIETEELPKADDPWQSHLIDNVLYESTMPTPQDAAWLPFHGTPVSVPVDEPDVAWQPFLPSSIQPESPKDEQDKLAQSLESQQSSPDLPDQESAAVEATALPVHEQTASISLDVASVSVSGDKQPDKSSSEREEPLSSQPLDAQLSPHSLVVVAPTYVVNEETASAAITLRPPLTAQQEYGVPGAEASTQKAATLPAMSSSTYAEEKERIATLMSVDGNSHKEKKKSGGLSWFKIHKKDKDKKDEKHHKHEKDKKEKEDKHKKKEGKSKDKEKDGKHKKDKDKSKGKEK